jgi:hypothetical protein
MKLPPPSFLAEISMPSKISPAPPILCHVEYEWLIETQLAETFIAQLKAGVLVDNLLASLPENFGLTTVHTENAPVMGYRVVQAVYSVQR